jgi:ribosome-binding protein aMBF1 (putative translation factor)
VAGSLYFLGYYPFGQETTADLVMKARRCQGMDQKELDQFVGVIHKQLRRWEHEDEMPVSDKLEVLHFLASN